MLRAVAYAYNNGAVETKEDIVFKLINIVSNMLSVIEVK